MEFKGSSSSFFSKSANQTKELNSVKGIGDSIPDSFRFHPNRRTKCRVHDEKEMDRMLRIDGIELIGINNRNLETFKVDIGNTKKLLEGEHGEKIRQKGIIVVGESGLFTPADVAYVQEAGVKAILVGESIVKQKDPTKGIRELFGKDISA